MNQIEAFTQNDVNRSDSKRKIEIPVNVNVLYRTAAENISLAQIQSQIDILNKDFNATNSDFNQVPALFAV
jgi:tRNA1(Val) A37 N6-methylase TrmN6